MFQKAANAGSSLQAERASSGKDDGVNSFHGMA